MIQIPKKIMIKLIYMIVIIKIYLNNMIKLLFKRNKKYKLLHMDIIRNIKEKNYLK
jgi:hypothetical protein